MCLPLQVHWSVHFARGLNCKTCDELVARMIVYQKTNILDFKHKSIFQGCKLELNILCTIHVVIADNEKIVTFSFC